MYAIIKTGGKQYKVQEGDTIFVEKLEIEENSEISISDVLVVGNENDVKVGAPFVEGATVTAKALKNGKAKKVIVYKFKAKENYRRKAGHRQPYTKLEIVKING